MGFSTSIKDEIFSKSARHCCVCHRYKGINIEIHHITPKKQGGKDTFENAIALCFDCHADAGHYFAGHPKGSKLSPTELIKHKEEWFNIVQKNNINIPKETLAEVVIENDDFKGYFSPSFIKEKIKYLDRNLLKETYELLGKNTDDIILELKQNNEIYFPFNFLYKKIKTYDDYIDFLNGDFPEKKILELLDETQNINCQPIKYLIPNSFNHYEREINLSNCVLNLKLINKGSEILKDYKLYFTFENIVSVENVNKKTSLFNTKAHIYNLSFINKFKAEFYPIKNILLQNDSILIDPICFRIKHNTKKIKIKWELLARKIQTKGEIECKIIPKFELKELEKFIAKNDEIDKIKHRILPKIKFE